MNLNKFAAEVHENAKNHGWWDDKRGIDEIIALIHSEWSEALEEYRAGRPMVWHECKDNGQNFGELPVVCESCTECSYTDAPRQFKGKKPEGIAVELVDGCIRILDLFGKNGYKFNSQTMVELEKKIKANNPLLGKDTKLPTIVTVLHQFTSRSFENHSMNALEAAFALACCWVRLQGYDPEALMIDKHEYNKGRPYKHGGKVC